MSKELTAQEIRDKIDQVKKDIETVRNSGDGGQRIDVMYEYINYLEYELSIAENKN